MTSAGIEFKVVIETTDDDGDGDPYCLTLYRRTRNGPSRWRRQYGPEFYRTFDIALTRARIYIKQEETRG